MSKQSNRKELQGYKEPKDVAMCGNCDMFTSKKEATKWGGTHESILRCGLGKFAVKKTASCNTHMHKTKEQ